MFVGDEMGVVTETLDACWKSVEIWPALKDSFQRKFKTDDAFSQLALAGIGIGDIGDKAAIAFDLQPFEIVPRETQALNYPIAIRLRVWRRADKFRATIDLVEEIIQALFRATESGGATPLQIATCGQPQKIAGFGVGFENIRQGEGEDSTKFPICYGTATVIFMAKKVA